MGRFFLIDDMIAQAQLQNFRLVKAILMSFIFGKEVVSPSVWNTP